ncbi:hypothetical protein BT96DRAFT_926361 [Gymnopus androsaceus JB14]|uniref:Uncharacterized protein n=1 Tax=Gymnopus androsaceus JB14 TaxID=1447944 RepID=A0A6A4GXS0_9AGAR|nr:hypothetical protein BT96DRAFT_926361 [Gymnopus androsaceus JB14]
MTRFFTPQMHSILLKSNYFFNKLQSNVGSETSIIRMTCQNPIRVYDFLFSFFRHWREE